MLSKKWLVMPPVSPAVLRRYQGVSPILAHILYHRGFADPKEAYAFLTAENSISFNPFLMSDMAKAVGRARLAIKKQELIVIYGDFDADGATSTALLIEVFRALGANVHPYIPHRVDEGYGLNAEALYKLAERGARLVITVDCGIRSLEEVEVGKEAGLDIIVTDHHSLGPELPQAFAVVNPKRDKPPVETMLAGVGVAYKFAEALIMATLKNEAKSSPLHKAATQVNLDALLDLVAIGTVADLAPLNKLENRLLVRRGLKILNQAKRLGVQSLMEVAGIMPGTADAMSIGFGIGPRINAAGRLESALTAYRLLLTEDEAEAKSLALKLQTLNEQRQDLTRDAQEHVRQEIETQEPDLVTEQTAAAMDIPLIFASSPDFQHGIVGLVAGKLVEQYYRPAIVMREGEGESNASCRSIPQFDITQALDECADLLVRHGGHAQAAGFTILNQNVEAFRNRLNDIAEKHLSGQDLRPILEIDAEVDVHQLSEELVEELRMLEPTGHANPSPVLMSRNVYVSDWRLVGRDERHIKLKIARAGQPPLDAIGFNLGEWASKLPERIDVAYALEINEWNGRRNLQLNLKDIRPAEEPQ